MCVDECTAAGYHALEFMRVRPELDEEGKPIADPGFLAPVIVPERCVGCGLCQTRCHGIHVEVNGLLERTAIEVLAGPGREDRMMHGSYVELHRERDENPGADDDSYLPDFLEED